MVTVGIYFRHGTVGIYFRQQGMRTFITLGPKILVHADYWWPIGYCNIPMS